jgi:hypothetical protein
MMRSERCIAEPRVLARGSFLRGIVSSLGQAYCRLFHNSISRPVEGNYRCWTCLREFDINWK